MGTGTATGTPRAERHRWNFVALAHHQELHMKLWDRKAKMDEMETLDYVGWQFLCAGEQLPSGLFQATVRYKAPPGDQLRTLKLDSETFDTASQALAYAKELATKWASDRRGDGRGTP
jgi:hypothetical protein